MNETYKQSNDSLTENDILKSSVSSLSPNGFENCTPSIVNDGGLETSNFSGSHDIVNSSNNPICLSNITDDSKEYKVVEDTKNIGNTDHNKKSSLKNNDKCFFINNRIIEQKDDKNSVKDEFKSEYLPKTLSFDPNILNNAKYDNPSSVLETTDSSITQDNFKKPEYNKKSSATIRSTNIFSLKAIREKFYSLTLKKAKSNNVHDRYTFSKSKKKQKLEVDSKGEVTYKKTSTNALISAIQLGIAYSVGKLTAKPERDILLQDFYQIEYVYFPASGTSITPSHKFADFSLIDYSPNAFRYFRDIFSISPQDFLMSLSVSELRELSNPGASGSLFFLSEDDVFIIKSVYNREAKFLQSLLPGYYLNLHQNPRTFLPKFFGMYCYKSTGKDIRLIVMNNLIPSKVKIHQKYDLKGSTFKRKASSKEKTKDTPTYKDLDFMEHYPDGIKLSESNHKALISTLERDIRVLESFKIMDYSLLVCIHNSSLHKKNARHVSDLHLRSGVVSTNKDIENNGRKGSQYSNALTVLGHNNNEQKNDLLKSSEIGGIPAVNEKGESLLLFVGIIDILQNYRLAKKTEHHFKAMIHDGSTISVHNPAFYSTRFLSFCKYAFQVIGEKPIKPPKHSVSSKFEIKGAYDRAPTGDPNPSFVQKRFNLNDIGINETKSDVNKSNSRIVKPTNENRNLDVNNKINHDTELSKSDSFKSLENDGDKSS